MRWSLTLIVTIMLIALAAADPASAQNGGNGAGSGTGASGIGTSSNGMSGFGSAGLGGNGMNGLNNGGWGYSTTSPYSGYGNYPSTGGSNGDYGQPWQYAPSDPAQRGIEAVKLAALKEYPSSNTWGYDYPYSMAYRAGTPMYIGHNYGVPSGVIYEYPALMPYGTAEPTTFYGDPEYSMFMNYGQSFPFHGPVYAI